MRSIDEQIDAALRLFSASLPQTLLPAALGACVGGIPAAIVLAEGVQPPRLDTIDWSAFAWAWLFQLVVSLLVQGTLLKMLALRARNGVVLPLGEALHAGGAMLPAMVLAGLLYLVLTLALFVMILPGFWLLVAGMFCAPAVALEGREALDALKRSVAIVRGRWWRTFGLLVLAGLVGMLCYLMFAALLAPVADMVFGGGWPTEVVVTTAVGALLTPLYNALLLVMFLDYTSAAGTPAAPAPPPDQIAA